MHYVSLMRKLRNENGLTQQQIADYLHIDRSTYAYYESGRTKINIDILVRLAHFFQISLAMLIGEEFPNATVFGNSIEESSVADAVLIDYSISCFSQLAWEEKKLVILYRSGNSVQREKLLVQANELTKETKP